MLRCIQSANRGLLALRINQGLTENVLKPIRQSDVQQRFFAARAGKRAKMLAKKRAKNLEKVEVKKEFIPFKIRKQSALLKETRSLRYDDSKFTEELPDDDVIHFEYFKRRFYDAKDVITFHKQTHDPTMYNLLNSKLQLTIELNMKIPNKNRFLDKFKGSFRLPFPILNMKPKTVLVFAKTTEDQEEATKAGAEMTGGLYLIKQIQDGKFSTKDYEFILAHVDILTELFPLRSLLKKKLPVQQRGTVGTDIVSLTTSFVRSMDYYASKDETDHNYGWIETSPGPLTFPTEHLEANIEAIVRQVYDHRPPNKTDFIARVVTSCEPSREYYFVDFKRYLPVVEQQSDDESDEEVRVTKK